MNTIQINRSYNRRLLNLAFVAGLLFSVPSLAATIQLATSPLTATNSITVKPNVMFILDDSGSMKYNYLPDWANDSLTATTSMSNDCTSTGGGNGCPSVYTDVPALLRNSGFNGIAYDPAVTYSPPVHYNTDGTLNTTTYPNIGSPWTSVKDDAYGKVSTTSTNLVTAFPDVEWCTTATSGSNNNQTYTYANCLRNDNLILPGRVNGVDYTVQHAKASTGSGNVASDFLGSTFLGVATTTSRSFGPFFYTIIPGEYCDSSNLKNCQSSETTTFSIPAYLRWCDSAALTNCQGINTTTFKYPRYPTIHTPAVAYVAPAPAVTAVTAVTGVAASASFTFTYTGSMTPTGFSIRVNGTEILTSTIPGSQNANGLATWVKNNSSLTGYNITNPSNGKVTITANSAVASTFDINSIVVSSDPLPSVSYTTSFISGAGVAPSNGKLVITTVANASTSIKCGTTFIGTSAAYNPTGNGAARLAELYTKINGKTVNGYSTSCDQPTTPMTCTITPPVGASACSGGFTLSNITSTTNTGPIGGSSNAASGSLTFTNLTAVSPTGFSIKVNGTEILTNAAPGSRTAAAMATWVVGNSSLAGYTITANNNGTVTITANSAVASTFDISSIVVSSASTVGTTTTFSTPITGVTPVTAVTARPAVLEVLAKAATDYGRFVRTDIVSSNNSYPYPGKSTKADTRTDCAGTTCTYAEEMTNFANWWTYYQTRMQSMKTSVSRAFKALDNRYRVGFTTISDTGASNGTGFNNATFLGNDTFELAHKNRWFNKLFGASFAQATPLRGAISKAGRYYGNKITGEVDPVQYSCQQNFAILSTDGYWNVNDESPSNNNNSSGACTSNNLPATNYGAYGLDNKTCVGNLDGGNTKRPMFDNSGSTANTQIPNSLADVAKYYYDTDLRAGTANTAACKGGISTDFPTGNPDVCLDNVFKSANDDNTKQHMTIFTMGLGADGLLNYTSDYATATTGDYYDLANGFNSVNWPNPITNSGPERIDDLWHAAVNSKGNYFSAKNPNQIIDGFKATLSNIEAKLGSAAAAATSTLNPIDGNNFAYVASYTTKKWIGNLEARSIDTTNGAVSKTASWCVENIPVGDCAVPLVPDTSGSSTVYNCIISNGTSSTCSASAVAVADVANPGNFNCVTQMANLCNGTMSSKISPTSDSRSIYTAPAGNLTQLTSPTTGLSLNLVPFDAAYATANPTNFATSHISSLNQWSTLSTTQQTAASTNLINYLRGQNGFEDRTSNAAQNRLYRARAAVLGDALESQPAYNSIPVFNYPYPGYNTFKSNHASRFGSVYMGTNDGMLHAFAGKDETTLLGTIETGGTERWAYVPSMVIPNMWKLASSTYEDNHFNFVNGSPIISDVCTAYCSDATLAVWKTILVGGLNGGGRGYFALDVTEPNVPVLLWEFTPSCVTTTTAICTGTVQDDDLGYSFGNPVITRKADGTWVVLVTSGYNNINPGTGGGFLYALDAGTGKILSKISTGVGNTTTPSGLSKISTWNDEPAGNKAGFTYGGDLLGNVWRFNINTNEVMDFATLADSANAPQPVTTAPILGTVAGKRVIFIGTGKFLEKTDVATKQVQSLYAIKDDNVMSTLFNPRSITKGTSTAAGKMVNQTITQAGAVRTGTNAKVDFTIDRGWYLDFPDGGGTTNNGSERVNIDGKLVLGTLIIPTVVPSSEFCTPGGYGWLNYFNYENGNPTIDPTGSKNGVNKNVSLKYDSAIVGINVIYIAGKPVVEVVTANNPTPLVEKGVVFSGPAGGFKSKRVLWREFIQ